MDPPPKAGVLKISSYDYYGNLKDVFNLYESFWTIALYSFLLNEPYRTKGCGNSLCNCFCNIFKLVGYTKKCRWK